MRSDLLSAFRPAIVMTLLLGLLLGLGYPLVTLGIGQIVFPWRANGSLLTGKDGPVGSALIGQNFTAPGYFHGRPSAAGKGYDATASSGSNLAPTSQALIDRVQVDLKTARTDAPGLAVPPDLVTTSASGLDPDISPDAALFQVARVAKSRKMDAATVRALVASHVEAPYLGIVGDPHVNVLSLNRALDAAARSRTP